MLDRLSVFLSSVLPSSNGKGRKALKYRGKSCLNCNQKLDKSDRYCPNCSQLNSTRKLHFKDFFFEFFAGIFAYDSRLVRTLKTLAFKPGKITREYIAGRRMHYANPFRFYLSVSIIFFLLWGIIAKIESYKNEITAGPINVNFNDEVTQVVDTTTLQKADSLQQIQPKKVLKKPKVYESETEINKLTWGNRISKKIDIYNDFHEAHNELSPSEALDKLGHQKTSTNLWLYKKVVDLQFFTKNKEFAIDYFLSKLPFVIFFFIPLFALCIKLLYLRKNKFTYMEHLTFAFHVQSFLFVLLIFGISLNFIFSMSIFTNIFTLAFVFYLYKAMRHFYQQNRFKTIVKFMILNTLFTILATFTATVYVLLSFSLY